jgi:hypothetical protein
MYVYYGTNEYNFEKLENPPDYEPTKCSKCGVVIKLGAEGFTQPRHPVEALKAAADAEVRRYD